MKSLVVEALQPMNQHGTVLLAQHIFANLYAAVRPNPNDVTIECRVVQLAERQAIRYDRFAGGMFIRKDMSRLQELVSSEVAHGAVPFIRIEYTFAKGRLMQALLEFPGRVSSPQIGLVRIVRACAERHELPLINADRKCQATWIIANELYRPGRLVDPRNDAVKIDEWNLPLHSQS